jgi:hypothetical protein
MSRLHIEPYYEHFAVYDGEEFLFVCETLFKAEIEMKHRLAQIEIAEKFAKHAAEIEALKKEKNPRQHGRKGGEESGKSKREAAPPRREQTVKLIKRAVANRPSRSKGEIVGWVLDKNHLKERWEGEKPYRSSTIYDIINDLVRNKIIPEPRDPRK